MFPIIPANSAAVAGNQEGIFGFGSIAGTNLVSSAGVVASDVTQVGTNRSDLAGTQYGDDKGIFSFGAGATGFTNLVSNAGVVANDVTQVGTNRSQLAACSYGTDRDKGIFGFGEDPPSTLTAITNLVSNAGVVASDQAATTGTDRERLAACEYGDDKGIFGFGRTAAYVSMTNLVSNTGVIASDVTGVGFSRMLLAACAFGGDQGIFGFGAPGDGIVPSDADYASMTNIVSNTGVVASDTLGVSATGRKHTAACEYGGDKGIFGFGNPGPTSDTNLISNTGVCGSDVTGIGTAKTGLAACSFD